MSPAQIAARLSPEMRRVLTLLWDGDRALQPDCTIAALISRGLVEPKGFANQMAMAVDGRCRTLTRTKLGRQVAREVQS